MGHDDDDRKGPRSLFLPHSLGVLVAPVLLLLHLARLRRVHRPDGRRPRALVPERRAAVPCVCVVSGGFFLSSGASLPSPSPSSTPLRDGTTIDLCVCVCARTGRPSCPWGRRAPPPAPWVPSACPLLSLAGPGLIIIKREGDESDPHSSRGRPPSSLPLRLCVFVSWGVGDRSDQEVRHAADDNRPPLCGHKDWTGVSHALLFVVRSKTDCRRQKAPLWTSSVLFRETNSKHRV
jgi:hypothetical protein